MKSNLLTRDGLLYIAMILVGYGSAVIESQFTEAIIALAIGAVIIAARAILKKLQFAQ